MNERKNIHPELLQTLKPSAVQWTLPFGDDDIRHILDGTKYIHYQIVDGKDLADAMSFFKPRRFRPDKECKVIFTIRIKESYKMKMHELDVIKSFIDVHIKSEDVLWGFGIDNNMKENITVTIAASYKYFYHKA